MNTSGNGHLIYAQNGVGRLDIAGASYGLRGHAARITYTVTVCRLGSVLLAATAHGICWVGIHKSAARLEGELHADFTRGVIVRNDSERRQMTEQIIAFIDGESELLDLPIDLRATAFQLAVWRELCAIPPGTTRSYGEIAQRIGRPGSARAVGRANGSNPLAILIPCHRAVGADGKLTGYRWGLEYKRHVLELEQRNNRQETAEPRVSN